MVVSKLNMIFRMVVTDEGFHTQDMTIFQDVYFGGAHSADYVKTYKNGLVLSPLKSFIKVCLNHLFATGRL